MEPVQSSPTANDNHKEKPLPKRPFNLSVFFTGIVFIMMLLLATEFALRYHSIMQMLKTLTAGQVEIYQQRREINLLHTDIKLLAQQQEQTQSALNAIVHASDQQIWLLKEADYLTRLAQYNLLYTRNVDNAITLLKMADQRVSGINHPDMLKVRQALANNIISLQAIPKLDLPGLLTKFTALQMQVNQLPILLPSVTTNSETTTKDHSPNEQVSSWHKAWKNSLAVLQKLVVIRRTDGPIVPLLPDEQRAYLQQNLQLLLQQALWSALHHQAQMYQTSLQQISVWVDRYYAKADASKGFLQAIAELQKVNVEPVYPNLTSTINLLQNFVDQVKTPLTKTSLTINQQKLGPSTDEVVMP